MHSLYHLRGMALVPLLGLVLLLAALAAGLWFWVKPVTDDSAIRIGINAWPGYEFLYLAQEKGYYKDAGVRVELVEFNSLSDARRAYERGQIDGLGTTVIEVLQAHAHGADTLQIVQVADYSEGADVVLAQAEQVKAAASTQEALRGSRVGVELGSLGVYVLYRALEKHGLSMEDVKIVSMDQLSMEEAFAKKELDVVVSYPPTSINLERDTAAQKIFTSAEIPGEVVDVLAFDGALLKKKGKEVQAIIHAFHRAMEYTRADNPDAYAIMAEREGISAEEFRLALSDGIALVGRNQQQGYFGESGTLREVIKRSLLILQKSGQVSGEIDSAALLQPFYVEGILHHAQ